VRLESRDATHMHRSTSRCVCVWNANVPEPHITIIIMPAFQPDERNEQPQTEM
jgi:hypothetical protein